MYAGSAALQAELKARCCMRLPETTIDTHPSTLRSSSVAPWACPPSPISRGGISRAGNGAAPKARSCCCSCIGPVQRRRRGRHAHEKLQIYRPVHGCGHSGSGIAHACKDTTDEGRHRRSKIPRVTPVSGTRMHRRGKRSGRAQSMRPNRRTRLRVCELSERAGPCCLGTAGSESSDDSRAHSNLKGLDGFPGNGSRAACGS